MNVQDDKLPFLVNESVTPVQTLRFDANGHKSAVFCVNVPINVLSPTVYNLSHGNLKTSYSMYASILGFFSLLHFFNYMCPVSEEGAGQNDDEEADDDEAAEEDEEKAPVINTLQILRKNEDGEECLASEVLMEFLLQEDIVVEDNYEPNLADVTGIRFYFVNYDTTMFDGSNFFERGCEKLLSYLDKLSGKARSFSKKNMCPFEYFKNITTTARLAELICEYMEVKSIKYRWKDLKANVDADGNIVVEPKTVKMMFQPNIKVPPNTKVNQHYEVGPDGVDFAYPQLVFRIDHNLVQPGSLFALTLPGSTPWEDLREKPALMEYVRTSLSNSRFVSEMLQKYREPENGYRQITAACDKKAELIKQKVVDDPERLQHLLRVNSYQHMNKFHVAFQCTGCLGPALDQYSKFSENFKTFDIPSLRVFDHNLSYFANYIADEWRTYEDEWACAGNLRVNKILELAALNTLQDKQGVRPNILMPGAAGIGKSFMMGVLREKWIPGDRIVAKITDMTANSFMTDQTTLFQTTLCDEAPPILINTEENGTNNNQTGNPVIKEILSEQEASKNTCFIDENGTRKQITTKCEYQTVFIMATNEPVSKIHESFWERLLFINVFRFKKDYLSQKDMGKEREREDQEIIARNKLIFIGSFRQRQIAHLYIEICIRLGVLQDVDLSPALNILQAAAKLCGKVGFMNWSMRMNTHVLNLIRSQVIQYAIIRYLSLSEEQMGPVDRANSYKTFAPRYDENGNIEHLGIQPFLIATEEVALFVVSCLIESYDGTQHYLVLEAIINSLVLMNVRNRSQENEKLKITANNITDAKNPYAYARETGFLERVSAINMYISKHTRITLSDQQIIDSQNVLSKADVVTFQGMTGVHLNLDFVNKNFRFCAQTKQYKYKYSPEKNMRKIAKMVQHQRFGYGFRLLIAQPFDINHQDILSVCDVEREGSYKPFVKEVRSKVAERNSNITRMPRRKEATQPSGNSSPELIALQRQIPIATHKNVYDLLYSFPFEVDEDDEEDNLTYPEAHVLDAHATTIMPDSPDCVAHVNSIRAKIAKSMPELLEDLESSEDDILENSDLDQQTSRKKRRKS